MRGAKLLGRLERFVSDLLADHLVLIDNVDPACLEPVHHTVVGPHGRAWGGGREDTRI